MLGREQPAEGTIAVRLARPAGFVFRAGQNASVTIADAGGKAHTRTLSLASAPHEPELLLATRSGASPFKVAFADLAPGAAAHIEGPYGSLVLHRATHRDAMLIAGGIGVTPFRSMLRQAFHDRDPRRFTLVYSNVRPGTAAFLAELQALERDWDHFRMVATMTGLNPSERDWAGERRAIGAALIRDAAASLAAPVFHLAGSPAMVDTIRAALAAAGVDEDDIRGEEFFGYDHPTEAP